VTGGNAAGAGLEGTSQNANGSRQLPKRVALEVVVVPSDSGQPWMPWGGRLLPVDPADLPEERQRILLRDLWEDAEAAASRRLGKARRRKVPRAVRLVVTVRSGGFCEMPGCSELGRHFHHRQRIANGGGDHPGEVFQVCEIHHAMIHKGAITGSWDTASPGQSHALDAADRKVLFYRDPARSRPSRATGGM